MLGPAISVCAEDLLEKRVCLFQQRGREGREVTGFDVKCQGEVGGQEQICSGDQHKLRLLLFQNPLFFMRVIK